VRIGGNGKERVVLVLVARISPLFKVIQHLGRNGQAGKEVNVWEAPMDGGADREAMIESVSIGWA
jgi:hypothetical protein